MKLQFPHYIVKGEALAVGRESGATDWDGDGCTLTELTEDIATLEISHFTKYKLTVPQGSRIPVYVRGYSGFSLSSLDF